MDSRRGAMRRGEPVAPVTRWKRRCGVEESAFLGEDASQVSSRQRVGGDTEEEACKLAASLRLQSQQKGTSQFRGVSWSQSNSKWRAQLCHGETAHHLGYFDSEVEAAQAYDQAAIDLKGPAAVTNFPSGTEAGQASKASKPARESNCFGVTWDDKLCKWVAELWDGHCYQLLGAFNDEKQAATAYDFACLNMYGPEAIVNFPAREQGASDDGLRAAQLELAAMEVLASMSSNAEAGTHFDTSPNGTTEEQQVGSPKRAICSQRQETPDTDPVHLQPTPSPYQDSTCDHVHNSGVRQVCGARPLNIERPQLTSSLEEGGKCSSMFKGVSWHKHSSKWYAYIQQAGRMRAIGYFQNERDAAAAYDAEALKIHGRKAVLNFPAAGRPMNAPAPRGAGLVTRAQAALQRPAKGPDTETERGTAGARGQGVKWNPTDGMYHAWVWDKGEKRLRSRGSFESKAAAVRAMHRDSDCAVAQATSEAPGYTAELSRCSFGGGSAANSPFSRLALQPSDMMDGSGANRTSLEPASSIKSPLKVQLPEASQGGKAANKMGACQAPPTSHQSQGREILGKLQPCNVAYKPTTRSRALCERVPDSDNSSIGIVGNSWGQGSCLADLEASEADGADSTEAAIRRQDRDILGPSSRSGSPIMESADRQVEKRRQKPTSVRSARGSSKYKGVSWSERSSKWRAQMWFGNKVHHLGFFDSEEAAAKCYDAAVLELRGPSAPTNFDANKTDPGSNPIKPSVLQNLTASSLPKVTSRYRGVRWHYCNSKWEARIFNGTRQVSLGYFENEVEAAKVYDAEARSLRGAAAVVNFTTVKAAGSQLATQKQAPKRVPMLKTQNEQGRDFLPAPPSRWGSKKRRL